MLGKVKFQLSFFELQYTDLSLKNLCKNMKKMENYLSEIMTHQVTNLCYFMWGEKYFAAGIFFKRNQYEEQIMAQ